MMNAAGKSFSGFFGALAALAIGCGPGFDASAWAAADAKPKPAAVSAKPGKPPVKPAQAPKPARKPSPGIPGFAAAEKGDWKEVRRQIALNPKAPFSKVMTWMLLRASGSGASFDEIRGFLEANPSWPDRGTLTRRAEEAIWTTGDEAARQKWFANGKAATREGALWLAAQAEAAGREAEAAKRYRDLWTDETFSADQEKTFLADHGQWIRPADHRDRLDRLIWQRRFGEAHRQIERVDADTRALAEARIAMATMNTGAANTLLRVPKELRTDPGLVYEQARWLRRLDKDDEATILLLSHKGARPYSELWWAEQAVLARDALAAGRITQAYELASRHEFKSAGDLAEAEWLAGWIAFQFLKDPGIAEGHFQRLYDAVSTPVSKSRGAYWLGRVQAAKGDAAKAAEWFGRAATEPTTFYGQLAAQRVSGPVPPAAPPVPQLPKEATSWVRGHEFANLLRLFAEANEERLFATFSRAFYFAARTDDQRLAVVETVSGMSLSQGVRLARLLRQHNIQDTVLAYPVPKWIDLPPAPAKAVVLGIIRQESNFDTDAVSSAGARGLMQLMPKTAASEAKLLKQPYSPEALTQRPNTNVLLGSHYLDRLLDRYDRHPALAFAAYNAGESRVDQWLKLNGDPRTGEVDMITWIESIPFKETRNYVQRVLENVEVYRRRVGGEPIRVADNP